MMYKRYKRLRVNQHMRDMVSEISLNKEDFVYPIFVSELENTYEEIKSMPNQYRYSIDKLHLVLDELLEVGIYKVLLFGIPLHKDELGTQAYHENGIIQQAIRYIKSYSDKFFIIGDVCMCEYTSHGHCGVLKGNLIDNDKTLEYLKEMALSQAKAGVDMIAPSDMHDGRIKVIRQYLDENGYHYLPIMSYSAKFASNYYGPFRDAAGSMPSFGDRKTYQMDYRNRQLPITESINDLEEGADIIMVKPGLAYLDVLARLKDETNAIIAVYNVSGEYSMIKYGAMNNLFDEKKIVLETMYAFKRAGANIIITYFALDLARYLDEK